mgnify:CR=1 FL=1
METLFYDLPALRSGVQGKMRRGAMSDLYTGFYETGRSYGAKGIRVTKKEEIEPAFREAMKSKKTPYVIEFEIDPEDLVYPMIQPAEH